MTYNRDTFAVASSTSSQNKPGKLRQTLGELESALASWDQIIPSTQDDVLATEPGLSVKSRTNVPDEMKRRTRELLNQLKEQIEELSTDEKPSDEKTSN